MARGTVTTSRGPGGAEAAAPGRPAMRRWELVTFLRGQIVGGRLKPGEQLPTQAELKTRFNASNDTVQAAIHDLRRQGFIVPRGRGGTTVADFPPHLHHFGLVVIEQLRPDVPLSRYHLAMLEEARRIERQSNHHFSIYHLQGGHTDDEGYQHLARDLDAGRLAGLFFTMPPFELIGTPVLDEPGVPRVTVGTRQLFKHVATISASFESWLDQAFDHLKSRGRREVAVVSLPVPTGPTQLDGIEARLSRRGLKTRPHWQLHFHADNQVGTRNALHLLFHADNRRRPDALIVLDDNLVEPATAGLAAAGLRAPDDVEVVAMCNYPLPPASAVPVTRLGYDAGAVLRLAVNMISAERAGQKPPGLTGIPALFEQDWKNLVAARATGVMA